LAVGKEVKVVMTPALWKVAFTAMKSVLLPWVTKCQPQPSSGHESVEKPGFDEPMWAGFNVAL
jgi:hypothetical protein